MKRLDARGTDEQRDRVEVKRDALLQQLLSARPAQIDNYVENNATSLAGVQQILKIILKVLVLLARREFGRG